MSLDVRPHTDSYSGGRPCSVGVVLEQLPAPDRAALESALADRRIVATQIYTALSAEGWNVAFRSIGSHRRGQCRCHR